MNVFGKAFIGSYPGHKALSLEVLEWKKSKNVTWARENLWNKVDIEGNQDSNDTYINRITKEVLKDGERTANNCLFVVAIVDLMFDSNLQSTTLSGELITRRMAEKAHDAGSCDDESGDNESGDNENENAENRDV